MYLWELREQLKEKEKKRNQYKVKEKINNIQKSEIVRLKKEIKELWFGFWLTSVFFTFVFWFIEPVMRSTFKEVLSEESLVTNIFNINFNYISVGIYYLIFIFVIISISIKWWTIRKYKKILKNLLGESKDEEELKNPAYVIDHSKVSLNKYAKGDREMVKRVFNQNNTVSIDSSSKNSNREKKRENPIRNYDGSTRSSNNSENTNIGLGVALGTTIVSTWQDNDCSPSNPGTNDNNITDSGSSCGGFE